MGRVLANALHRRLDNSDRSRTRFETLFSKGAIAKRDLLVAYEGLFLGLMTSFEQFLEELFIKILLKKASYPKRRVLPRVHLSSARIARDVLLSNRTRQYLDWLPYDHTEERARIYLRGGRPFTDLDSADKQVIRNWLATRHAIAHVSEHALRQFQQKVVGNATLLPEERLPAGYLRSQFRTSPAMNRFELAVSEMKRIGNKLI